MAQDLVLETARHLDRLKGPEMVPGKVHPWEKAMAYRWATLLAYEWDWRLVVG